MSVDWSQFRNEDRVRVTFEGTWEEGDMFRFNGSATGCLYRHGYLTLATSAELIERPFTPPAAGKLFRPGIPTERDCLCVSLGADGFRMVRDVYGKPRAEQRDYQWDQETQAWRDSIEVIDGV